MNIFEPWAQLLIGVAIVGHIVLLVLAAVLIALAFWSIWRVDREWTWRSFVGLAGAIAYIGVSFYLMG